MPRQAGILLEAWTTAQRIEQLVRRELENAGAWTPHYGLLAMVHVREPVTPTALARAMGMAPATLSDRLDELFALGHVRRAANPDDGRSYLIRTTAKGRRALDRAAAITRRMHRDVERGLGRPLQEVETAIADLTRAVEEALAASASSERTRRDRVKRARASIGA